MTENELKVIGEKVFEVFNSHKLTLEEAQTVCQESLAAIERKQSRLSLDDVDIDWDDVFAMLAVYASCNTCPSHFKLSGLYDKPCSIRNEEACTMCWNKALETHGINISHL